MLAGLHQFANLSVTQNPQSEYRHSGCGFSGTTRIVYDLLGDKDWNVYLDIPSRRSATGPPPRHESGRQPFTKGG